MGRGRKIIKWIKKHLRFRRKPFKKKNKKGKIKRTPSRRSLNSPGLGRRDIRGGSRAGDSPLAPACADTDSLVVHHPSPDKIFTDNGADHDNINDLLKEILPDHHHDIDNNTSGRERCPPLLPPIEEAYMSANIKPAPLPELEITTSKRGNVAFEAAPKPRRPKTPMPASLSARPPSRAGRMPKCEDWAKKMEVAYQRKQRSVDEIRQRCRQRVQRVTVVQARKCNVHHRPLLHGSSLLSELPSGSNITTRPPSRGGVAFQVMGQEVINLPKRNYSNIHRVFDNEFLKSHEAKLDKAKERRRQLLEALRKKQKEREEKRAAARERKLAGNVPNNTDEAPESGILAETTTTAVVVEEKEEESDENVSTNDIDLEISRTPDIASGRVEGWVSSDVTEDSEQQEDAEVTSMTEESENERFNAVTGSETYDDHEEVTSTTYCQVPPSTSYSSTSSSSSSCNSVVFRLRRPRRSREYPFSLAKRRLKLARAEESIRKWLSYYMPSASDAREESSLADRPKLERSRRNISFNKKVQIFQFTKELGSEKTSSTVLVHDVIKGQYEIELEMERSLFEAYRSKMLSGEYIPSEVSDTEPESDDEREEDGEEEEEEEEEGGLNEDSDLYAPQSKEQSNSEAENDDQEMYDGEHAANVTSRAEAGGSFTHSSLSSSDNDGWSSDEESDDEEEKEEEEDTCTDESSRANPTDCDDGEFADVDSSDSETETEWEKAFKPLKLPDSLKFQPLPLRFACNVDTRMREEVPQVSRDLYDPNYHPLLRRRYFVFANDRTRLAEYNLNNDDIIPNPSNMGRTEEDDLKEKDPYEVLEDPTREFIDCKIKKPIKDAIGECFKRRKRYAKFLRKASEMTNKGLLDQDTSILPRLPPRPLGTPFVGRRRPLKIKPISWTEVIENKRREMFAKETGTHCAPESLEGSSSAGVNCNENIQVSVNKDSPSTSTNLNDEGYASKSSSSNTTSTPATVPNPPTADVHEALKRSSSFIHRRKFRQQKETKSEEAKSEAGDAPNARELSGDAARLPHSPQRSLQENLEQDCRALPKEGQPDLRVNKNSCNDTPGPEPFTEVQLLTPRPPQDPPAKRRSTRSRRGHRSKQNPADCHVKGDRISENKGDSNSMVTSHDLPQTLPESKTENDIAHQVNDKLFTKNTSKSSAEQGAKVSQPTPPPPLLRPLTSGLRGRLAPITANHSANYQPSNGECAGMRAYVKLPPINVPHRVGLTATQLPQVSGKDEDISFSRQRLLNPVHAPRRKLMEHREHKQPNLLKKVLNVAVKPPFFLPSLPRGPITAMRADVSIPPDLEAARRRDLERKEQQRQFSKSSRAKCYMKSSH